MLNNFARLITKSIVLSTLCVLASTAISYSSSNIMQLPTLQSIQNQINYNKPPIPQGYGNSSQGVLQQQGYNNPIPGNLQQQAPSIIPGYSNQMIGISTTQQQGYPGYNNQSLNTTQQQVSNNIQSNSENATAIIPADGTTLYSSSVPFPDAVKEQWCYITDVKNLGQAMETIKEQGRNINSVISNANDIQQSNQGQPNGFSIYPYTNTQVTVQNQPDWAVQNLGMPVTQPNAVSQQVSYTVPVSDNNQGIEGMSIENSNIGYRTIVMDGQTYMLTPVNAVPLNTNVQPVLPQASPALPNMAVTQTTQLPVNTTTLPNTNTQAVSQINQAPVNVAEPQTPITTTANLPATNVQTHPQVATTPAKTVSVQKNTKVTPNKTTTSRWKR